MKKILRILIVLLPILFLSWGTGSFGAGNDLLTAIANLAQVINKQFGISDLRVAAVNGNQVYINAGKNQFIKVGTVYEIIAEGAPVIDPVSKRKIGALETHLIDIKITTVRADVLIGELTDLTQEKAMAQVKVGLKAIEKAHMFSIAVIKFDYLNSADKTTPKIAQEFMINELINTGRFLVADSARTDQVTTQLSATAAPGSVEFTRQAGRMLGVEYIMYGQLVDIPGFLEIQCHVHDVSTGTGIAAGNVQLTPVFIQPTPN